MIDPADLEEETSQALDLALWTRLWHYTRPYRVQVVLLCMAGMLTAAIDVLFPLVTKWVLDELIRDEAEAELGPYIWLYGGLTVVICACVWAFIWLAGRIRTAVAHDIRRAGFDKLQELSFSYFDHRPVGWLMARMTSDCERLSNILAWAVLDLAWGATLIAGMALAMFLVDWQLALATLAIMPVLALASGVFRRRILETARAVRKTNSRITASYNEGIMGVRTSKVFVREQHNLREFQELTGQMYGASVRNALHSALYLPVVLTFGSIATGLVLSLGGAGVMNGALSIGTLALFLLYARHMFDPIEQLAHWFAEMQMAQASAERVLGLIDTEPEIRDSAAVRAAVATQALRRHAGVALDGGPDRIGTIEFAGVGFRYKSGAPVLADFDLTVDAGETIALVGPTGGGKTTIVNLLCRFYEPTAGEIRLDGVDYRRRSLHWLQSHLGIVLQEPHLFRGSVADNIRYGALDATQQKIEAAALLAGAHDFISALQSGYASEVGEGGNRLSTGQKQLVSFARAILAGPQILVMDEATSSVDTETEGRIQAGLARVLSGRTSFVIAHRLSTIRAADRILVIEGGRILEEGSHGALLKRKGRYHALYTEQSLRDSVLDLHAE